MKITSVSFEIDAQSSQSQITVPKKIRDFLGLEDGREVEMVLSRTVETTARLTSGGEARIPDLKNLWDEDLRIQVTIKVASS